MGTDIYYKMGTSCKMDHSLKYKMGTCYKIGSLLQNGSKNRSFSARLMIIISESFQTTARQIDGQKVKHKRVVYKYSRN